MQVGLRPTWRVFVALGCAWAGTSTALRAQDEPPSKRSLNQLIPFDKFEGFEEPLRGMDWAEEAGRVREAARTMWRRNGWNDETDLFARDVAIEVAAIPPWDVSARLNLLSTRIAERYELPDERAGPLQASMFREAGRFFGKNRAAIFELGREALATRAQGRAFTSEQVSRWAQALPPLMTDVRQSVGAISREIEPLLDNSHRERLHRDIAGIDRRAQYIDTLRVQWAAGKWRPSDWGLDHDPIQTGAQVPGAATPALPEPVVAFESQGTAAAVPTRWVAHEPKTWNGYVLNVEKRYHLDSGQQTAARSIYSELVARATDYSAGRRAELQSVPAVEREKHALFEPICSLFSQLQERLEALPTTAQRESSTR